ncbi:helix-turn-helix domain-containing protein [Microbulbifer sp. TYP-18]|uniref:helix-turn-helix domain-containing protein n=1 Tax=Microbulbifer sp. TYP-18 TaxID=3230024 RepID=UPI0034C5D187
MSDLTHNIAKRLKEARKQRGLRSAELGKLLGLSASQVSKIENSQQKLPVELLPTWCESVGINLAVVFGEEYAHHFLSVPFPPHIAQLYVQLPSNWQEHLQQMVASLHRLYQKHKKAMIKFAKLKSSLR